MANRMQEDFEKKEKKDRFVEGLEKSAIEGAAAESIQRFGDAAKQHYVSYSGVDNETGKTLTKSLKSISQHKINPDHAEKNIKQQAGFSAEVKTTARRNAEKIINRESTRTSRTDDLGSVNDQIYDLVEVDAAGNKKAGTGSQMKFVGGTPEELLDRLNSKKFQKYLDADALLDIADDDYDALMGINGKQGIIDQRIEALKKQIDKAEENGKTDVAASKREQMAKYEKIKKNLRKTGMTREEAIEARLHPKLSAAKDIVGVAHRAGKEQAGYGAAISGSFSLVKNIVACSKGEKTPAEAAQCVILDTGKGAAVSYATAFTGTTIKGAMQNAASPMLRNLANTNLAAGLVTTTLTVGRSIHRYITGEIDGVECIEELGQNGLGEIGSAMFGAIGVFAVPSTASAVLSVIGGVAGATFGYAAAVAIYQELSTSLKEAKLAHEERIKVEAECAEAIKMIQQYRMEMEERVSRYLSENIRVFDAGFSAMDEAILANDVDGFIRGNADIQKILGRKAQFTTFDEFEAFMDSDMPLKF